MLFTKSRKKLKMVSCIEIETASLVFASLSLSSSCMGVMVCIALLVHINVLMAYLVNTQQRSVKNFSDLEIGLSNYGLYINLSLAVTLAIVIVSLIFSIILTKGLISKKAHLVKAYFIYGVTANVISGLFALVVTLTYNAKIGMLSLLGCFLYGIILIMIKSTYLKLSTTNYEKFSPKNLEVKKQVV